jgi:putative transposase
MHVLRKDADFEAFQRVMIEALRRDPIRMLSYCVLSNHWHFVVWSETDGQVTKKKEHAMRAHGPRIGAGAT